MKNKLCNVLTLLGDQNKVNYLVNEFDEYWNTSEATCWDCVEWIYNEWLVEKEKSCKNFREYFIALTN